MFSRFTEKAIQAIMSAQEHAKNYRHSFVGTEHVLLGILSIDDNVILRVFQDYGYSQAQIIQIIEDKFEPGNLDSENASIPFTQQAKQVLNYAWDEARQLGHNYVNIEHLFLALFRDHTGLAAKVFNELGINLIKTKEILFDLIGDKVNAATSNKAKVSAIPTPTLDIYGRDLTWLASDDKLDPVIGRIKEIDRIVQILSRRTKNNPVLTGEAGVGKTAIVEGLAQRIIASLVPETLKNKRVFTLDLGLLVAGTKYRGEFEDRVKKVMEEVKKAGNIILFIDELHTIIGTGGSEGSLDAANLFKPALARGELQCIGATTLDEYRKHIEGDAALERRFQSVLIEEPSIDETISILTGIRSRYENFHHVEITDQALEYAAKLSDRYITDRHLPDKAVDLIDEAASKVMLLASNLNEEVRTKQLEYANTRAKLLKAQRDKEDNLTELQEQTTSKRDELIKTQLAIKDQIEPPTNILERVVTEQSIADIVASWTGVPVLQLTEAETHRLLNMEEELSRHIIGQTEAIKVLCRAVKRAKVGLKDPRRPTGSFLFLGPSGVGKSELARVLAKFLFGNENAIIRIDMSEYMEKHTVSRLIGSPPGYVGYDEGGQLTEPVRRRPYSVVLFDELEKASPEVTNILLQILDDGKLTDSTGRKINFKNTIVIMTSNVGAKFIQNSTSFGFVMGQNKEQTDYQSMKTKLMDELKKEFKPEFLNRIDDIVIFRALNKEDIKQIVHIMFKEIEKRLTEKGLTVVLDEDAVNFLADKGFDESSGARPLRRAIQLHFEDALADRLLTQDVKEGDTVYMCVDKEHDKLVFNKTAPKKETPAKEPMLTAA